MQNNLSLNSKKPESNSGFFFFFRLFLTIEKESVITSLNRSNSNSLIPQKTLQSSKIWLYKTVKILPSPIHTMNKKQSLVIISVAVCIFSVLFIVYRNRDYTNKFSLTESEKLQVEKSLEKFKGIYPML